MRSNINTKAAQQYVVAPMKVDKDYTFGKNIVAGVINECRSTSVRTTLQELKSATHHPGLAQRCGESRESAVYRQTLEQICVLTAL